MILLNSVPARTLPAMALASLLSHVFLDCVVARPVVAWLTQVWGAIIGRPAPPITAAVLLAGDHRAWPVDPDLQPLWTRLCVSAFRHL